MLSSFFFSSTVKGFPSLNVYPVRKRPWHKNKDKTFGVNAVCFIMALAHLAKLLLCLVISIFILFGTCSSASKPQDGNTQSFLHFPVKY